MRTGRGVEEEVRPRTTRTCEGGVVRASEMEGKGERKDRLDVVRGHASARGRLGQGEGVQARVHGMDGSETGASGPFVPWFSEPALPLSSTPSHPPGREETPSDRVSFGSVGRVEDPLDPLHPMPQRNIRIWRAPFLHAYRTFGDVV